jgi:hypothetical protein
MKNVAIFYSTAAFVASVTFSSVAFAQSDPVILTIDGKIAGGVPLDFTSSQLEALGAASVATSTPWHDGKPTFEGIPMETLLAHVGATGEVAEVLALNNYRTTIPLADFSEFPVLLALQQDGEYMTVRNKGPLFIIYPFDDFDDLRTDLYYSRSAWQVRSITVK